ncbi:Hypothetical protein SRAE_1000205100 [Strongyloides ratti]|uniref:Uncharacterized protein n=1 Tax=Strongyloides ratti TaxID=34506 RepID=A0A090L6R3_STRRB|nr:Hypothetical protein SRAE_1000205100 [Strongyloides ratti]CEF63793.1 Hypothetical protein SRAE_1000205100 [Strongyloides ratti]
MTTTIISSNYQKFTMAVEMFNETTLKMKKQIKQQKYGFEYYTRYFEKTYFIRALYLQATIGDAEDSGKKETPSNTLTNTIDKESQLPSPSILLPEQSIKQRRRSRVIRNFSKIKEFCSISEFETWLNEQKMWSVGTKNELKDRIIQNYRCKFSRKSKTDCMKSIRLIKYHNENIYSLEESDNAHDHSIITTTKKDFSESIYDNDKKFSPTESNVIQNSQLSQNNILVEILNGEDSPPPPPSPNNIENSIKKNNDDSLGRTSNDNTLSNFSFKNNQSTTTTYIESQQKMYNLKDSSPQNVLFKLLKSDDNQTSPKTSLISVSPSLSIRPQSAPVVVSSYRFMATFRDKATFQKWFFPISNEWIKKSKDYESDKSIKYFICTYNVINSTIKKEHSSDNINYCPATLRVTSYNLKEEILVEDSVERHNHINESEYNKAFDCQESNYMGNIKKYNNKQLIIDNRSSSEEPLDILKNTKIKNEELCLSNHPPIKTIKRKRIKRNKFKKLLNHSFTSVKEADEWLSLNKPNFKSHIRKIFDNNEQIYYICSMYGRGYTKCKKQYRIIHEFNRNYIYIEESRKSHNHEIILSSLKDKSKKITNDYSYDGEESFMWNWIHGNEISNAWKKLEKMDKLEAEELFIKEWYKLKDMLPNYMEYWKLLNNPQISEEELKAKKIELSIPEDDDKLPFEEENNFQDIEWIIEESVESSEEEENNI